MMCLKWNVIEFDVGGLMIVSDCGIGKFIIVCVFVRRLGREIGK